MRTDYGLRLVHCGAQSRRPSSQPIANGRQENGPQGSSELEPEPTCKCVDFLECLSVMFCC